MEKSMYKVCVTGSAGFIGSALVKKLLQKGYTVHATLRNLNIARYFHENYPEFHVKQEHLEGARREIHWGSTKLNEKGFVYKYDTKTILDDCLNVARKLGDLQLESVSK